PVEGLPCPVAPALQLEPPLELVDRLPESTQPRVEHRTVLRRTLALRLRCAGLRGSHPAAPLGVLRGSPVPVGLRPLRGDRRLLLLAGRTSAILPLDLRCGLGGLSGGLPLRCGGGPARLLFRRSGLSDLPRGRGGVSLRALR